MFIEGTSDDIEIIHANEDLENDNYSVEELTEDEEEATTGGATPKLGRGKTIYYRIPNYISEPSVFAQSHYGLEIKRSGVYITVRNSCVPRGQRAYYDIEITDRRGGMGTSLHGCVIGA